MNRLLGWIILLAFIILAALILEASPAERGVASWYGPGFHGRRAADGSIYNQNAMTAAHKKLPFGSCVRVTLLATGKSVKVRITDRGPFIRGRIIDLSRAAMNALRMGGLGQVTVENLGRRRMC
jgi:rare lipoprotein A